MRKAKICFGVSRGSQQSVGFRLCWILILKKTLTIKLAHLTILEGVAGPMLRFDERINREHPVGT